MPLRSVEAATRDDAIAAAREQFGATARVVGVRRVRSGGVLGFFATERYVAEVDPEPAARPVAPAPTRNGAAAYVAARATPAAHQPRDDDARVDELAGLLGSPVAPSVPRASGSRPAAARAPGPEPEPARAAVVRPAAVRPAWSELLAGTATPPAAEAQVAPAPAAADPQPLGSAATPSPFTAALARMVAGDRDVQQAVEDALAAPGHASTAMPGSEPTDSEPLPTARTTEAPLEAQREEEPVELQDWTPSSTSFDAPAAPPVWGTAQPEAPTASSREEAIAEVLRAALVDGRSDEALAGILRRVMDGVPPAAALAEAPVEHLAPEPFAEPEPVDQPVVLEALSEVPVGSYALTDPAHEPVVDEPVVVEWSIPAAPTPASELGWDDPVSTSSLWADVLPGDTDTPAEVVAEAETIVEDEPVVEAVVEETVVEETAAEEAVEAPVLARTASDPAPPSLESTSVLPPLSLLPPLPGSRRGGRPPVPPSVHRGASDRAAARPSTATAVSSEALATVTRLRLFPTDEAPAVDEVPVVVAATAGDPVSRLAALGVPADLLDGCFAEDVATRGTYAALTRALTGRLPEAPELPSGAGEVLVVVGPGVEALRAARALAVMLRLDPDRVQWATRGDLAGLVPASSRMATVETAAQRRQEALGSGALTIVAVDAPLRARADWTAQMLAVWAPAAVWAVVEATRKPEDLGQWVGGLPRVDALVVQDTDLSADPAAVLSRIALPLSVPVAVVDGMRATPHRWASLLCERLESAEG